MCTPSFLNAAVVDHICKDLGSSLKKYFNKQVLLLLSFA